MEENAEETDDTITGMNQLALHTPQRPNDDKQVTNTQNFTIIHNYSTTSTGTQRWRLRQGNIKPGQPFCYTRATFVTCSIFVYILRSVRIYYMHLMIIHVHFSLVASFIDRLRALIWDILPFMSLSVISSLMSSSSLHLTSSNKTHLLTSRYTGSSILMVQKFLLIALKVWFSVTS